MTDYRMFYEKDYLGAWNIPEDGDLILTIVKCSQGELNQPGTNKKTKKPVVKFKETEKGMALNATNGKTIAGLYGNKVEDWAGKKIALYKSRTRNPSGGDDVDCLRVRPKPPKDTAEPEPIDPQPYLDAIANAATLDELKEVANAAWKLFGDTETRASITAAKDKRKTELTEATP